MFLKFACLSTQTLGINCLFVEGASEVLPLSVAKVFCNLWRPEKKTSFCCTTSGKGLLLYIRPLVFCITKLSLLVQVTLDDHKSEAVEFKIIWLSSPDCLKCNSYFSSPKFIEFSTEVPGEFAFGYFYPPSNPEYKATRDEKPPLVLQAHGMLWFETFLAIFPILCHIFYKSCSASSRVDEGKPLILN